MSFSSLLTVLLAIIVVLTACGSDGAVIANTEEDVIDPQQPLRGEYEQIICSYEFRYVSTDGRYVSVEVPTFEAEEGTKRIMFLSAFLRSGPNGCFEGLNEVVPGSSVRTAGPIVLTSDFEGESVLCLGDTLVRVDGETVGQFDDLCISGSDFTVTAD